ncbi:hypothetical protein N8574_02255 [Akkermansiaceae bacterium]|nr:hypothetical protein [Akkermansiaceae bacterium]
MKKIFRKFLLLAALVVLAVFLTQLSLSLVIPIKRIDFGQDLAEKQPGESLDVLVIGTSHGRAFRDMGLADSATVYNASQSGLGIQPLIEKIRYIDKRKEVKNLIVFVDEWQISSESRSNYTKAYDNFVYDQEFAKQLLESGVSRPVLGRYFLGVCGNLPDLVYERIAGFRIEQQEAKFFDVETKPVKFIDPAKAAGRSQKLYMGSTLDAANNLSKKLSRYLSGLQKKGVRVIVCFPPLPLKFRDAAPVEAIEYKKIFISTAEESAIPVFDFSGELPDDQHYADEDHLTSSESRDFSRERILPLLDLGKGVPVEK